MPMKNRAKQKLALIAAPITLAVLLCACSTETSVKSAQFDNAVSADGKIHVPANYRSNYEAMGTWSIAADGGAGAKEMHLVYASPGATESWKRDKHFADGTVLVKEVYETDTAPMTTGTVSRAKKLKGWFVMVRAAHNPHPGNALWGDGWGWAWFDAGKPNQTTSTDYKAECMACHEPAKMTDYAYVEGYPRLNE